MPLSRACTGRAPHLSQCTLQALLLGPGPPAELGNLAAAQLCFQPLLQHIMCLQCISSIRTQVFTACIHYPWFSALWSVST